MKILYVTTIGGTMNFFNSFINRLINEGHTVDIATNENSSKVPSCYHDWGCTVHQIDASRSPLNKGNLKAIRQLKMLVEQEKYDIVHCHTPIAAMCTRLACRKARKKGTKVIYTAHGFHFFKGAPLKNWLLYYPVEKLCAYFTDVLITINQEDFNRAKKHMKAKKVVRVPGVGIDLTKFGNVGVDRATMRRELGLPEDAVVLLSVGELNENKNQQIIIRAMRELNDAHIHYLVAGEGYKKEELLQLSNKLGLEDKVHLLGYRSDINDLCNASDIFCFPSRREGLGLAALEAMACGVPIVTSNVHGINDYSENGVTGYKCAPDDLRGFVDAIKKLAEDAFKRKKMGENNREIVKRYNVSLVTDKMKDIYFGE